MGKVIVSGKFIPVSGHEVNYLKSIDFSECHAITDLVRRAGGIITDEWEILAFEHANCAPSQDTKDRYEEEIRKYREITKKQYPPFYKITVSVELEELPEDESKAYWEDLQSKLAKIYEHMALRKSSQQSIAPNHESQLDSTP